MAQDIINGDLVVNGKVNCTQILPSQACITNAMVASPSSPANAVDTTKLRHRTIITLPFNGNSTASAATVIIPAHYVHGTAGSIVAYGVGSVTKATSDATAVYDLLKNGSSILSGTIQLDSGNTNRVIEAAPGFSSTTLAAGDCLEAKCTSATAGSGAVPVGAFFQLIIDEDPS